VKEWYEFARCWIDPCEVRALPKIAAMTSKREVLYRVAAAMLPRDDMFDVVFDIAVFLRQ
jgi:hypothetical protein